MGQYTARTGQRAAIITTDVGERIIAFLRRLHPQKTADHVAAETGVPASTVAKWIERESIPNGLAIFRLIYAYGPEFLAAVYPQAPRWLDQSVRAEQQAQLRADIDALQRRLEDIS